MEQLIDLTQFLGERDLAFRGSLQRINDSNNGNFLGLIELLSQWNPILKEHVLKVQGSQRQRRRRRRRRREKDERLQVHYLSNESHNEFIAECCDLVKQHILGEKQSAKYYVIIVDFTPDSSMLSKQHSFCIT